MTPPRPITDLPNLGPVMARRLAEVGVENEGDLRALGAAEAYRRLCFQFGRVSLNALYAMDAALEGKDWRLVPEARKLDFRKAAGA